MNPILENVKNPTTLLEMLEKHEGYRATPYECTADKWTVAIGRNIEANPLSLAEMQDIVPDYAGTEHKQLDTLKAFLLANPVEKAVAHKWLAKDLQGYVDGCREDYPGFDDWPDARQHALVDMSYNMGRQGLRDFPNMNAALAKGDWETAAIEALDSDWARYDVSNERSSYIAELIRGRG